MIELRPAIVEAVLADGTLLLAALPLSSTSLTADGMSTVVPVGPAEVDSEEPGQLAYEIAFSLLQSPQERIFA